MSKTPRREVDDVLPSFMKLHSSRNALGAISEKSLNLNGYQDSNFSSIKSIFESKSSRTKSHRPKHDDPRLYAAFTREWMNRFENPLE